MAQELNSGSRCLLALLVCLATVSLPGCHHGWLAPPPVVIPSPPPDICTPLPESRKEAKAPEAPQLIDLPTALRLANVNNPTIAFARERIREALAKQER